MPTSPTSTPSGRRARHDPRETEREILDAAEQLPHERPFREFTVPAVMARTGLKRPAFYVDFRDRHDLALASSAGSARNCWWGVAAVDVERGPVLRAVADASGSDATVEKA